MNRTVFEVHLEKEPTIQNESMVRGLGVVHLVLGTLSSGFTLMALLGEESEINKLVAPGLWAGFVYVGCGLVGVLVKWHLKVMFLVANLAALGSTLVCPVLIILGYYNQPFEGCDNQHTLDFSV